MRHKYQFADVMRYDAEKSLLLGLQFMRQKYKFADVMREDAEKLLLLG